MNTQHIPEITGSNFAPAQEFTRQASLSQWRMTAYIESIKELIALGTLPTDTAISIHVGGQRNKSSTRTSMKKIVALGYVREAYDTDLGTAYELTATGVQANARIKEIKKEWRKLHESNIEPPAPDYTNAFQKLNRTINLLEDQVTTQSQLIEFQNQQIASLKERLANSVGIY